MPAASSRVAQVRARASAYVRLTKPRVIELLLVTAVPAMVLAADGMPAPGVLAAVLVGGALAAGGANTFNSLLERDRDQFMRRTHDRPLPRGEVSPRAALVYGIALEVVAFALLARWANLLAAGLAVGATLFYVVVYTVWLKPRTVENIVIGGAAGAAPTLVGWAAVTGRIEVPAVVLFAIVFCWTPPHFWALAIRYADDYRTAGIPMLPVVAGLRPTVRRITAYAAAVVVLSLTLPLVRPTTPLYPLAAAVLGVTFLGRAWGLARACDPAAALAFFRFSNLYLAALFVAMALDVAVGRL
jgi:protoheme IX farnesyltransferase